LLCGEEDLTVDAGMHTACIVDFTCPSAADDSATTPVSTPIKIAILANDMNVRPQTMVCKYTQPQHGTVRSTDMKTVTYTPQKGWSGQDSFTYTICDKCCQSTATVTVTVGSTPLTTVASACVPCESAKSIDFSVCEGTEVNAELIKSKGAKCEGCSAEPLIEISAAENGYDYKVTCSNDCGTTEAQGHVTVTKKCTVSAPDIEVAAGTLKNNLDFSSSGCGDCDATAKIDDSAVQTDASGAVTGGSYIVTCETADGCQSKATGQITVRPVEKCTGSQKAPSRTSSTIAIQAALNAMLHLR
jgi:hypothetical protein